MGIGAAIAAGWYIFALRSENNKLKASHTSNLQESYEHLKTITKRIMQDSDQLMDDQRALQLSEDMLKDRKKNLESLEQLMLKNKQLQQWLHVREQELAKIIEENQLPIRLKDYEKSLFHFDKKRALPLEMIMVIVDYLPLKEMMGLRCVNHQTQGFIDQAFIQYPEMFFKKFYRTVFPSFEFYQTEFYAVAPLDQSLQESNGSLMEFFQDLSKFFCGHANYLLSKRKMVLPITYAETFFRRLDALGGAHAIKQVLCKYPLQVWIGPEMLAPQTREFYPEHLPYKKIEAYDESLSNQRMKKAVKAIAQYPHIMLQITESRPQDTTELKERSEDYLNNFFRCLFDKKLESVTRYVSLSSKLYNALVGHGSTVSSALQEACKQTPVLQTMHIQSSSKQYVYWPIPKVCQEIVLDAAFAVKPEWGLTAFTNLEYMLGIRKFDQPNKQLQPDNHNVATLRLLNYPLVVEKLEDNPFIKGHNIANLIVHISNIEGLTNELKEALQLCVNNSATLKSMKVCGPYNHINWGDSAVFSH
jgi:hypothetical protein